MQNAQDQSFGKYRLIAALGQGGMAKVYLALMAGPAGFNKLLVVKILREDLLSGSAEGVQMFWEEARLAARLAHPNIVQTHEVGEIGGRYFIAMEYLDGQSYSAILKRAREGVIPLSDHLRVVSEVARGLHYSHHLTSFNGQSLAVVHRDVSPHNIFVTYDGQVKLLDFGVATTQDSEHVTRIGVIKGKLDYIAPEQLRGDTIDGRADIFALGAVLFEVVSGQRFAGGRKVPDLAKAQARISGGERKIREVKPDVAPALEHIIERAIAVDPAMRWSDAGAFADALDAYIEAMGERPSAKSISAVLTRLFASERAAMLRLIEEQLQSSKRRVEIGDATGSLPQFGRQTANSGSMQSINESSLPSLNDSRSQSGSPLGSSFAPPAVPLPSAAVADKPVRRGLLVRGLMTAGVMGVGAALAMLWPRSGGSLPIDETTTMRPHTVTSAPAAVAARVPAPPVTTPPPIAEPPRTEAPQAAAPSVEREATSITLQVSVTPPSAQLVIDGVAVGAPFSGEFRRDSALHYVEASADGWRPIKQFVRFDRDQTLTLALERTSWSSARRSSTRESSTHREPAAPPPVEAPAVSAPPKALPGSDIEPARAAIRRGTIDQSNPYRTK